MIEVQQITSNKTQITTLVQPANITTITFVKGTEEAVITFINRENVRINQTDASKFK